MQDPQKLKLANRDVAVRPLREDDLAEANHIMRVSFGTFLGMPEPAAFMGDAGYVRNRFRADPTAAFAAEVDGQLAGSNFATHWGSVGFFGPLTVRPELWDRGIAKRLMEPVMDLFGRWGLELAGLFTFPHSQKHVGLYQRFGFWPRFLTAVMSKPVATDPPTRTISLFSEVPQTQREACLAACRELTSSVFEGLDLELEITAVVKQNLGETVLLWDGSKLSGLAVCHSGPGTEAGSGSCYVKFAAVRPGPAGDALFNRLLDACEALASAKGVASLVAGVNTARHEAYRSMLARGFRTQLQGVAMHRDNEVGYNRPGVYLIDDWR